MQYVDPGRNGVEIEAWQNTDEPQHNWDCKYQVEAEEFGEVVFVAFEAFKIQKLSLVEARFHAVKNYGGMSYFSFICY